MEEVIGAAVDRGGSHHMVAAAGDVENREEIGRLAGGGQHGRRAALQLGDLGRHAVVGGVLQAGVEIAAGLQIEELAHVLGGVVFEGRALHDGDLPGLSVFRRVAALDTNGVDTLFHSR